jgi:hypothetical protein
MNRSNAISCSRRGSVRSARPAGGPVRLVALMRRGPSSARTARREVFPPAHRRPPVDANGLGQLPHPSFPVVHHRGQHYDGGEIDLAAEKAQWRCPAAAAVHRTTEAEALVTLGADMAGTATRLANRGRNAGRRCTARSPRYALHRQDPDRRQAKDRGLWRWIAETGTSLCPLSKIVDDDGKSRTQ